MNQKKSLQDVFGKQKQLAPGLHPGIGLDQLHKLQCKCGNETFVPCSNAYLASPLQSKSGLPTLVQLPQGFVCTSCGAQNSFDDKNTNLDELKDKTSKNDVSGDANGESKPH